MALVLILGGHGVASEELYSDLETRERYWRSEEVVLLFGGLESGKNTLTKILTDNYKKLNVVTSGGEAGPEFKIIDENGSDVESEEPERAEDYSTLLGLNKGLYNTPSFNRDRHRAEGRRSFWSRLRHDEGAYIQYPGFTGFLY